VNGQMVRDVRTLLARRQPALVYLIALAVLGVATDLLVAAAAHQLPSFSRFSRHEFVDDVLWRGIATIGHASVLVWIAALFAIVASAALAGWLRACYLVALTDGRYALTAPTRTVLRLSGYWLILELYLLGLTAIALTSVGVIALVLQLLSTPVWLYAEYAIVFDDVPLQEGVRRSLRMFRVRARESILAVLVLFIVGELAYAAFTRGFTDSTHVEPGFLVAWELVGSLIVFVTDVVLVTLYRTTRGLSAAGSAGSAEAPSSGEPSD
jgi:hypothetical protein